MTDRLTDGCGDMASTAEVEKKKQTQHNVDAGGWVRNVACRRWNVDDRLGFSPAVGRDQEDDKKSVKVSVKNKNDEWRHRGETSFGIYRCISVAVPSVSGCCGDKSVLMLSWTYDGFKWLAFDFDIITCPVLADTLSTVGEIIRWLSPAAVVLANTCRLSVSDCWNLDKLSLRSLLYVRLKGLQKNHFHVR